MLDFHEWRKLQNVSNFKEVTLSEQDFLFVCQEYFDNLFNFNVLTEGSQTARYSVEVNYRTSFSDATEGFAKICLGYVSAGLKQHGFHTKHVYSEKPLRLLVSSRNWDDGSITGIVLWNHEHNCFMVGWGYYNKDRKTVSIQKSHKCSGDSAVDVTKNVHNLMHSLKDEKDRHVQKLKPVHLKRGPKS